MNTLLGWYRAGVAVQARLPLLSTYLGHVDSANTYWYLTATPELMQAVAQRLDRVRHFSLLADAVALLKICSCVDGPYGLTRRRRRRFNPHGWR